MLYVSKNDLEALGRVVEQLQARHAQVVTLVQTAHELRAGLLALAETTRSLVARVEAREGTVPRREGIPRPTSDGT